MDAEVLAQSIAALRANRETIEAGRKAVCLLCDQHSIRDNGKIHCAICGCEDPSSMRPRCPAGRWGIHPASACAHLSYSAEGKAGCALHKFNCLGCDAFARQPHAEATALRIAEVRGLGNPSGGPCGLLGTDLCLAPSADCAACLYRSTLPAPRLAVIIASRNETNADPKLNLVTTCESIKATSRFLSELLVIDDASTPPEAPPAFARLIRLEAAQGCAGARHTGATAVTTDPDVTTFCDGHQAFPDRMLDRVARLAQIHGCIFYAGCDGHYAADLRLAEDGLLRCKWIERDDVMAGPRLRRTTGAMGAGYFFAREVLSTLGGYPWLPGTSGQMNEELFCLLAAKCGIPIVAETKEQSHHLWRRGKGDTRPDYVTMPEMPYPCTQTEEQLNLAAVYRFVFDDELWKMWRGRLLAAGVPESIIRTVEAHAVADYGKSLRARCKLSDEELMRAILPATPLQANAGRPDPETPIAASKAPCEPLPQAESVAASPAIPGMVSCLTATCGRFSVLREAIACFVAQDYENRELVILNNHPNPLCYEGPMAPKIRIINEPGHPTLGHCRNRLLQLARGQWVRTWDDDDLYLPWTISQGAKGIGEAPAFKARQSWFSTKNEKCELAENVFEAAMLVRADVARKYGYRNALGDEHAPMLAGIDAEGGCKIEDFGLLSSYVYRWDTGLQHASGTLGRGTVEDRTAEWLAKNADAGGDAPLTPADVAPYWRKLLAQAQAKYAEAAKPLADALKPYIGGYNARVTALCPWPIGPIYERTDWSREQGTATLAAVIPGLMAAIRARTVIEIGICHGFTAEIFARSLAAIGDDGVLISCDINAQCCQMGAERAALVPTVSFSALCVDSRTVNWAEELKKRGREFAEVALVDGNHDYEFCKADLAAVAPVIGPHGFILCHDYGTGQPGVMKPVKEFVAKGGWSLFVLPEHRGRGHYASAVLQKQATGLWEVSLPQESGEW